MSTNYVFYFSFMNSFFNNYIQKTFKELSKESFCFLTFKVKFMQIAKWRAQARRDTKGGMGDDNKLISAERLLAN